MTANIFLGREAVKWRVGPIRIMDKVYMEQRSHNIGNIHEFREEIVAYIVGAKNEYAPSRGA